MRQSDETPADATGVFRPATLRGAAGCFRIGQDAGGRWWFVDPDGAPVFLKAVHGVRAAPTQADTAWPPDTAARLRRWRFNAVGVRSDDAGREDGLPFLGLIDFASDAPLITAPGVRLPDVFDPAWPDRARGRAEAACAAFAECRALLGWITDDELAWAPPSRAGRPSLLQICLSLEPAFAAYHAAWEFVLASHGGSLPAVAEAWNARLANKEVVRELTRAEEGLGTRGYLRDDARWTREFARRYFTTAGAAVRAADPNHLVLGCGCRGAAGQHVLAECVYPAIDVALTDWLETGAAPPGQPLLANNVDWTREEFFQPAVPHRLRRLTSVERMLRRARLTLDRLARQPAVAGYAWAQWQDGPGEQPPFARGLVHRDGAEAREHTEVLAMFNARAETLRRSAGS